MLLPGGGACSRVGTLYQGRLRAFHEDGGDRILKSSSPDVGGDPIPPRPEKEGPLLLREDPLSGGTHSVPNFVVQDLQDHHIEKGVTSKIRSLARFFGFASTARSFSATLGRFKRPNVAGLAQVAG